MSIKKHLYIFSYDHHENELCKLESKYLFHDTDHNKLLFSDIKTEPSDSAFIKRRLDVMHTSKDYNELVTIIENKKIHIDNFKIEYLVLDNDTTAYAQRLTKLKDIGYVIDGTPEYYKPQTTYALCYFEGLWIFGTLIKNSYSWYEHKKKPFSYSNSIHVHIAKALVNIASLTQKNNKLFDACCGVGTIMLEACYAGYTIDGCDINWKVCRQARENLAHFNYAAQVYRSDIKDIEQKYDGVIIDLPYNLFSYSDENIALHIIESSAALSNHVVIVSMSDIQELLNKAGLEVSDSCEVGKSGKATFTRKIWVCRKKA